MTFVMDLAFCYQENDEVINFYSDHGHIYHVDSLSLSLSLKLHIRLTFMFYISVKKYFSKSISSYRSNS